MGPELTNRDRKRRCRSRSAEGLQCEGEVTDVSMHIEDHWAKINGGLTLRWSHVGQPINIANPDRVKASDRQEAGDHYKKFSIQPWQIWEAYGLDPWAANALKYLLRAGHKGPKLEDLKKARHYLDYMIEREEGS